MHLPGHLRLTPPRRRVGTGDTCAHYEVFTSTFTTSCAAAQAAALVPAASTVSHGTPGNRECPQDADDCILSMRHYMRASCAPQERAPPFVIEIPYADGQVLDNLVIECKDLNDAENPNSLEVALYAQDPSVCGADLCTHEQLSMLTPMRTTSLARKRIFSVGVSSIEMQAMVCAADKCSCTRAAGCSFKLSLVVRCAGTPVRLRALSILQCSPHPPPPPDPPRLP